MTDIVSPILQWLNGHPELAGLTTFIISASESVAIIGTIIPGSIMMTAIGTLAGAGIIPLWQTIFWAILGAIAGDSISYWIGYYFKDRLRLLWPFKTYPTLLKTGEIFFHKYGQMSVFIGRFVGPVRALVPMIAGMLGMKPLRFTIANVTSAIGWAPAYMLPGIILGAASLELPPEIAMHVILVLLLIGLFIMLCMWFIYKLFQLIRTETNQLQNEIWARLAKSRYFSSITFFLKHHDKNKTHGQLTLAFFFILTCLLLFCLVIYVKIHGPANIVVNDAMFHFFRGVRLDGLDNIMVNLTILGQSSVILAIFAVIFSWLMLTKHQRAALHTLALGFLCAGFIFIIKHTAKTPRPWGVAKLQHSYSMPSGHTALSTALFMGLAFLIAGSLPPKRRWPVYTVGVLLSFAVAISRLYLGAHWFTDTLAGALLSAALLMIVIISYQREYEKPVSALRLFLVSFTTIIIAFSIAHVKNFAAFKESYAQVSWPTANLKMDEWWHGKAMLPAYRTSLFGFASQQINIAWAGSIQEIRETLLKEGWSKPPARDLISTLHRLTGISSTQYLQLVSPQYLDKTPALILTRQAKNIKNLLIIRLWDSNRTITKNNLTIWVGVVGIVPESYSWLYKKYPGDIAIDPALVFPHQTEMMHEWEWRMITAHLPNRKNHFSTPHLLLIRHVSLHRQIK